MNCMHVIGIYKGYIKLGMFRLKSRMKMIIIVNRVVRSLSRIDFDFVVNCMRIHGGFC